MVDGLGIGDVGNVVMRDRHKLSEDGIIIVALTVEGGSNMLLSGPEVISRGFVYVKESEDLIEEARNVVLEAVESNLNRKNLDWNKLKNDIRDRLGGFVWKRTERRPMILPIIMEV